MTAFNSQTKTQTQTNNQIEHGKIITRYEFVVGIIQKITKSGKSINESKFINIDAQYDKVIKKPLFIEGKKIYFDKTNPQDNFIVSTNPTKKLIKQIIIAYYSRATY